LNKTDSKNLLILNETTQKRSPFKKTEKSLFFHYLFMTFPLPLCYTKK
jgi:hypothetical protein